MPVGTIAIVDDDADTRRFLTDVLQPEGFHVRTFEKPFEALTFVHEAQPDLVILDYRMPEMDGLAFLESLQAIGTNSRVLVLTAHADPDLYMEAFNRGALEMLPKSVTPAELVRTVRRLFLDTQRLHR